MEGDACDRHKLVGVVGFNPRPRMEGDLPKSDAMLMAFTVSIHAPAWRATSLEQDSAYWVDVSIHAPAWRATLFRL